MLHGHTFPRRMLSTHSALPFQTRFFKSFRTVLSLQPIVLIGAILAGCNGSDDKTAAPAQKPTVDVIETASTSITPSVTFTGRIEAVDSVDLRARVQGFLKERKFTEGQSVKKGDLLFVIEKGAYEAQVGSIEGALQRLRGTRRLAELERDRQVTLVQREAVAQVKLDEAEAKLAEVAGDITAQNAALDKAKLDLGYTDISAPIDGKIGLSKFSNGDFVGPESGALARIVSQDPVYVTYPVTQRQLLEFQKTSKEKGTGTDDIVVKVRLATGELYEQSGKFNFVDVVSDPGTDTVTVRAEMPNPDGVLIDQQLVTVVTETGSPKAELTIPQQAIQIDQVGAYVLVVGDDEKVNVQRIESGGTFQDRLIVKKGLVEKQRVIVSGIQKVKPGMAVDASVVAAGN